MTESIGPAKSAAGEVPGTLSRRAVLGLGLTAAATACSNTTERAEPSNPPAPTGPPTDESTTSTTASPPSIEVIELLDAPEWSGEFPFTLGVASGDPDPSSVVLWTRLAPQPNSGGGMPPNDQMVVIDVALDRDFDQIVSNDHFLTSADHAHSVHHIATGLSPDSWYWYRFRLGEHTSAVGRARTTPATDAETPLRFAFSSCQNWESGNYAAHRHLAAAGDDIDLFVFLGDYIYEYGPGNRGVSSSQGLREHDSPEVTDLAGYRNRYALYKTDPLLQASHEARPWVITWDDHEVDNDYADLAAEDDQSVEDFLARRRSAYQAWWEHLPVRLDPPSGDSYQIHRTISWGRLADLHMLDGRQYRDPQPTDGEPVALPGAGSFGVRRLGPTALDPNHTMLGVKQERWLIESVETSAATWQLLGNQVFMHGLATLPGEVPATATDTWDGYSGSRSKLLTSLSSATANLVVLSGDFHSASVADVRIDPYDSTSPVVASEFMAPAISSTFSDSLRTLAPLVVAINPQIKFFDPDNGYMICELDGSGLRTEVLKLDDVTDEESNISAIASFTVRAGTPGIGTVFVEGT